MKLLNKLKYKLFMWLMRDICGKSGGCRSCKCYLGTEDDNVTSCYSCAQRHITSQALDVWDIE